MKTKTAREFALELPPDVLAHPMPLPQRIDYAEAIIKRAQQQAIRELVGESAAEEIEGQARVAVTTAFDVIEQAQTVTAPYRDEMENIVRQEVVSAMLRLTAKIKSK